MHADVGTGRRQETMHYLGSAGEGTADVSDGGHCDGEGCERRERGNDLAKQNPLKLNPTPTGGGAGASREAQTEKTSWKISDRMN